MGVFDSTLAFFSNFSVSDILGSITSGWTSLTSWLSSTWLGEKLGGITSGISGAISSAFSWFQDTKFGGWFLGVTDGITNATKTRYVMVNKT